MTTILNFNVDDIDAKFVENLKRDFAHADVEIHLKDGNTPLPMMSDSDFWAALDLLDWSKDGEDDQVVEPLVAFLTELPIASIYRFADLLSEKLWKLDTYLHARIFLNDPDEEGILSVDDFLYTRCAVVANGRAFYEKVLAQPEFMPSDLTFEPLLYVALTAYKRKTGKTFTPVHAYNYETYSNKEGWKR
ncbi:MAG: DUF4240 domain-containing protein [Saprospiraceae bacterium]|nr:DUF4240 domain-containing protein [Saprospiraceae bacterium]